ncbi:MAG: bifunctional diaminohydroxyphosphoribosylaminopyrimidine deaminase/5-amino-6-(5-phosphoribosylamino)uracil reductase RibD [Candidatus Kapabacteria bacterium]|nr:bifunctional diaminohydroxyphosphoribosylaminopyrimidine deaminase/5-amino-6-(5-phosphoribosylamino)uracil reductase RibD [Candidatus Kapabacteria bacterium]
MAPAVSHEQWMHEAIQCALLGSGNVSPNPRVGCVIVRDDEIIARGWHKNYRGIHAEVDALQSFQGEPSTATMYVSLEPCAHIGKQPPCVDAIVASGIPNVVVGMTDPNPLVAGRGIAFLRDHGINVTEGILRDACQWTNRWFSFHVLTGRSYVTSKIATSLDLAVSAAAGSGRWITSPESRQIVHTMRSEYDAVMVGVGTVLADDPLLTVRDANGRDPIRLIVDANCRTPLTSKIVQSAKEIRTVIFCSENSIDSMIARELQVAGVSVVGMPSTDQRLDPEAIVATSGEMGISSILLEGGPRLSQSFLNASCVNEIALHIAPTFLNPAEHWFESVAPQGFHAHSCSLVGPDVHLVFTSDRS